MKKDIIINNIVVSSGDIIEGMARASSDRNRIKTSQRAAFDAARMRQGGLIMHDKTCTGTR